jgi:hypothetical protein
MFSHCLREEPAIAAALELLSTPPERGGTRTQIDKWLAGQEDPEMALLAMVAKSPKVRRHARVRLTGERARPNELFSSKPWEPFFRGCSGPGKLFGTREHPGHLSVEEALNALVAFRAWKGELSRLGANDVEITNALCDGLHALAEQRQVESAEVFVIFSGRLTTLAQQGVTSEQDILQAVGRSLTSIKAAKTMRIRRRVRKAA